MTNRTALRLVRVRGLTASGEAAQIRERSGLTRGDVSRTTGIPVSTLRRWELGERVPTGDAALRYEALLGELQIMCGDDVRAS